MKLFVTSLFIQSSAFAAPAPADFFRMAFEKSGVEVSELRVAAETAKQRQELSGRHVGKPLMDFHDAVRFERNTDIITWWSVSFKVGGRDKMCEGSLRSRTGMHEDESYVSVQNCVDQTAHTLSANDVRLDDVHVTSH